MEFCECVVQAQTLVDMCPRCVLYGLLALFTMALVGYTVNDSGG